MRKIVIAVGVSRKDQKWKNKKCEWDKLAEKLATTTRTPETQKEYFSFTKAKQDDIKDIGGFVGGELAEGKRSKNSVRYRDVLTLDIDSVDANTDIAFIIETMIDEAYVIYSTHKHRPNAPRLRLVMPLSRSVDSEEYEAIARYIASEIGIDYFDDTTYQASRLMYWPSTSCDAEYVYQKNDGEWLDPDKVLAKYADWKDVTSWAYSSRVNTDEIRKVADKQEDPLEKDGVIGAFCKEYAISDAIRTFIPNIYNPGSSEDRYTYVNGSTSDGAVVYDDKYIYSHHSTDPISMKLCNAFDMVRVHKFGHLDEKAADNTPVSKLPSYIEMSKLVSNDKNCKKQLINEVVSVKDDEFENYNDDWMEKFDLGGKTRADILPTYNNIELILDNDPILKGMVSYDELAGNLIIIRDLAWRDNAKDSYWSDNDDVAVESYIEKSYKFNASKKIRESIQALANKYHYHPVKNYFSALPEWDGVTRAETIFIDYLGAEDSDYVRSITRKALSAAVSRIYTPGIKWDYMVTLVGEQGCGKSSLLAKLGMSWFSDSITSFAGKEGMESIQKVWIVEVSELTATTRADVETVKQFITKQVDEYRPAYGRNKISRPRQCVLFGTTNDSLFLRDTTGNRRFPIIECGSLGSSKYKVRDLTQDIVDQIWAEVLTYYKNEKLYLSEELEVVARELQDAHMDENPYAEAIRNYLEMDLPGNWYDMTIDERRSYVKYGPDEMMQYDQEHTFKRDRVCILEIANEVLQKPTGALSNVEARGIAGVLQKTKGWKKYNNSMKIDDYYKKQKVYIRIPFYEKMTKTTATDTDKTATKATDPLF